MIHVKACLLTESILADPETGQASLIGVVEKITGRSYPLSVPRLAFFALLEREEQAGTTVAVDFSIMQGGAEIARQTISIDFQRDLHHRLTINLKSLVLASASPVCFVLTIPGQPPSRYCVPATLAKQ